MKLVYRQHLQTPKLDDFPLFKKYKTKQKTIPYYCLKNLEKKANFSNIS